MIVRIKFVDNDHMKVLAKNYGLDTTITYYCPVESACIDETGSYRRFILRSFQMQSEHFSSDPSYAALTNYKGRTRVYVEYPETSQSSDSSLDPYLEFDVSACEVSNLPSLNR